MPHWPIISEHLILFYISLHFLICLAGSSCTFPILVQESAISPVTLVFLLWEMILQINIHAINEFYTNIHCYWKIVALSLEIKDVCEYTLIHLHREILKKKQKFYMYVWCARSILTCMFMNVGVDSMGHSMHVAAEDSLRHHPHLPFYLRQGLL